MQVIKNLCLIDETIDKKVNIIVFDNEYNILQYKLLDFNNSRLNNIYCGIVDKVEEGLDSCFVKIEDGISGFLPFKQCNFNYYEKNTAQTIKKIRKGDKILVQIIRDPLHNKNVKLSNDITLFGQFCVYMPFNIDGHGISSNVKAEQRTMFKEYLKNLKIDGSVIIRSSAIDITLTDLEEDLKRLKRIFETIMNNFEKNNKYSLIFSSNDLMHSLRSYSEVVIDKIYVRKANLYSELIKYKELKLIKFPEIIFGSKFEFLPILDKQIYDLYKNIVYLPSNGYIVIEKTEAMITIDVNSGSVKKNKNMEETAFKTNMEAVEVIVSQIILRNLGGIISIDFIDIKNEENIDSINEFLKRKFKNDRASLKILPMNSLCVVQISRERKGLSLFDKYYKICSTCNQGLVIQDEFLLQKILNELTYYNYQDKLDLQVNKRLYELLKKSYGSYLKKYVNLNCKVSDTVFFKISHR